MRPLFGAAVVLLLSLSACGDTFVAPLEASSGREGGWAEVERGVWERSRPGGGRERIGYGIEGLEYALRKHRAERQRLLEASARGTPGVSAAKLEAQARGIEALEAQLREAVSAGDSPPPPVLAPQLRKGPSGGLAIDFCGGTFQPDVVFTHAPHLLYGEVTASGRWTDTPPYLISETTIHTAVLAAALDMGPVPSGFSDFDQVGPFSGVCCAYVEASDNIGPTQRAWLVGQVVISSNGGGSDRRVYEAESGGG